MTADRSGGFLFLSHNSLDKPAVEALAFALLDAGVRPWLDKWDLVPGLPWQRGITDALRDARAVVVCVGAHGLGQVQSPEVEVALDRAWRDTSRPVIPVLLPGAAERPELRDFLRLQTWVDLRQGLTDAGVKQLVAAAAGLAPGPEPGAEGPAPYPGLPPFDEADAPRFFGREADVAALLARRRAGDRLLALIGASGSGKSSLMRAGLIPAIRTGQLDGSYDWRVVVMRPGRRPIHELAVPLTKLEGGDTEKLDKLRDRLRGGAGRASGGVSPGESVSSPPPDGAGAASTLSDHVDLVLAGTSSRLLLAVDQFEEVFTQTEDADERRAFIENLRHAATVAGGRTTVVLTLRADFMGRALDHSRALAETLKTSQELVLPMGPEQLRAAIERPALQARLRFDDGLVDALVEAVAGQPGDLPLLQFTLRELWRRREGSRLTWAAYSAIGGVRGAIARRAEAFVAELDPERRRDLRSVLGRLTQLGEGTVDTRRRATRTELESLGLPRHGSPQGEAPAPIAQLLDRLIAERLLTAREEGVEVAHEALIREWGTLREWIAADREVLRLQQELARDAQRWVEGGRNEEDLWRGARLVRAVKPVDAGELVPSALEREFLTASRTAERRETRGRRRQLVMSAVALVLVLGVLAPLAVSAARLEWMRRTLARDLDWKRISAPASGEFMMGCVPGDRECRAGEKPRHPVKLSRSFDIMAHEVTLAEFRRASDAHATIIGRWRLPGDLTMERQPQSEGNHPVVYVSWSAATAFCEFVGNRLPTEAEWEYAARGGNADGIYPWGNDDPRDRANGSGVGGRDKWAETAPVGSFPPNGYGLFDMAGNVWEWTSSLWGRYPYRSDGEREDQTSGEARVVRGGSWGDFPWDLRVSYRSSTRQPTAASSSAFAVPGTVPLDPCFLYLDYLGYRPWTRRQPRIRSRAPSWSARPMTSCCGSCRSWRSSRNRIASASASA